MDGIGLLTIGINDLRNTRYASMAAGMIVVYEHVVTLDREIELIWKTRWSIVKVLFFINRYYILFCALFNNYALFTPFLTTSVRLHWFRWQGWTGLGACMVAQIILQMRLYALYFLNKKVLAFTLVCFMATSTCAALIMGKMQSRMTETHMSELIPGMYFCIPADTPPYFYTFWIPILSFECLLCGLALNRGIRTVYSRRGNFHFRRDLVNILIRDSILYFLVLFATYLTNLVVLATQSKYVTGIPIAFTVAMSCVMCNRIILNVRGARPATPTPTRTSPVEAEDNASQPTPTKTLLIEAENNAPQRTHSPRQLPRRAPRLTVGLNPAQSTLLRDLMEMWDMRANMGPV